ncbi:MAG TPA: hypothetical protein VJT31_25350 [Rugosimonospora sp.]|nr:hypothetical protein [Rugosimonospora sp.]
MSAKTLPRREHTTCEHCGRALVRLAGTRHWRHVPAAGSCGDPDAQPVRPGSALRVLLLALLATGTCEITLYEDGVEIGGPYDASLLFLRGSFTTEQVAGLLGVPVEAVDDERATPVAHRPGDDPHYTRHNLTLLGDAAAWRYPADAQAADLSDHFWLAALGVEVMVRRRDDGVYVSVENDAIDPDHGPLLVEVNQGGANPYGDDHHDNADGDGGAS